MIIAIQIICLLFGRGGSILLLLPKESDDKNCIIMQLKLTPYTTYTWKINIGVTGVNPGLIAFLLESPHVTSICCFGSLPNRERSQRECLPDSISTARVSSQGWGSLWPSPAPGSLLKINHCAFAWTQKYQHAPRETAYSTQRRSTGASPKLNDTCASPPAASAAAAHRQQAGEH